jgi:hypothetical protein
MILKDIIGKALRRDYGECRDNYGTINKDDAEVVNDGLAEPGKEIIEEPRLRLP